MINNKNEQYIDGILNNIRSHINNNGNIKLNSNNAVISLFGGSPVASVYGRSGYSICALLNFYLENDDFNKAMEDLKYSQEVKQMLKSILYYVLEHYDNTDKYFS